MSSNSNLTNSGEGSRPTTDGGVDNIGGADTFTPNKTPDGQNAAPMPDEKMRWKRQTPGSDDASNPAPHQSD
jgi:hypothetical protein